MKEVSFPIYQCFQVEGPSFPSFFSGHLLFLLGEKPLECLVGKKWVESMFGKIWKRVDPVNLDPVFLNIW